MAENVDVKRFCFKLKIWYNKSMPKLIMCLGYHLEPDNSVHPVLKNRLLDAANFCKSNKNSTLLLMGSSPYGDLRKDKISEASAMKKYLEENFSEELGGTKIITKETTASTVEQLCYLKEFIAKEKLNISDLVVVSSEFFSDRVKLYAEKERARWLNGRTKGDDTAILKEQKEFQGGVIRGEIKQSPIS